MTGEECVLEELSPNGSVEAYVEQDDRVAYFYLRGAPESEFGVKSCWVRNLDIAPPELDVEGMRRGIAPMLPREFCRHPSGANRLVKTALRIVWFEEGDAAALLEGDEVLAIIPGWSGMGGFSGYARDCIGQTPFSWALEKDNVLHDRVRASEAYWQEWNQPGGLWNAIQTAQCEAYAEHLGTYQNYYSIDGGNWPPKAMLRIERGDAVVLVTVGVCLRAQPTVERYTDHPEDLRRIELGFAQSSKMADHQLMAFARYLSGQSGLPWCHLTWLGPFHTIPCDAFGPDSVFSAVLLVPEASDVPKVLLPAFRGDFVRLLWMVPITETERQFAVQFSGQSLFEKLHNAGHGAVLRERQSVV